MHVTCCPVGLAKIVCVTYFAMYVVPLVVTGGIESSVNRLSSNTLLLVAKVKVGSSFPDATQVKVIVAPAIGYSSETENDVIDAILRAIAIDSTTPPIKWFAASSLYDIVHLTAIPSSAAAMPFKYNPLTCTPSLPINGLFLTKLQRTTH